MSTIALTCFSIHNLSLSKSNLQQKKQDPLWIPTPKLLTQYPILRNLSSCKTLTHLTQIYAQTITTGAINDKFVSSRILAFLALSPQGSIPYARLLFSQIHKPDVFIANTLIRGYASSKNPFDALAFYVELLENSVVLPDIYTYPLLLKACSESPCVSLGRAIHGHVYKLGFSSEVSVLNFLVQMYASCGVIESAKLVFDRIPECDYASWNIMIGGYLKCGLIESAREVFDGMLERDVISWSVMINGYVQESRSEEGLKLFREMLAEKTDPNESVLVNALSACAHLGAIEQGAWIEGYMKRNNVGLSVRLGTSLIYMYSKCGCVDKAYAIFDLMKEKNVLAWTAMINGLAINGRAKDALHLFNEMEMKGIRPNEVTFIAILSACSHSKMVNEGRMFFDYMTKIYGLKPNAHHYCCLVDLYGRAGMLDEAKDVVKTMPFEPNSIIFGALLNACRIHGNAELGEEIGKKLLDMEPGNSGRYVLLSNIYAASGRWDNVAMIRSLMKERGVNKTPGSSFIDLKGSVHEFVSGDNLHPESEMIYAKLDEMSRDLRLAGHEPKTGQILLDMDEEEKQTALYHHSEKLAIAFALCKTDPGTTIRITKNLRVCEDCHLATKLISKLYNREIVVRDRCRFHHFKDGSCSCNDFW